MSSHLDPAVDAAGVTDLLSPAGFSLWVQPHWAAMSMLASRLAGPAGPDVVQDAASDAWRKRSQFDPVRGSARSWLLSLVADQASKSRRRTARRREHVLVDRATDTMSTLERDLDIDRAIARLSERQRLAVGLYYYLGLPITEAAAVMKCAEGTVKSTLADARSRLRDELGRDFA